MSYIKSLFHYLFQIAPGSGSGLYLYLGIFAVLLIIGSIIFSNVYKKKRKTDFAFKRLFKKVANRMMIIGILIAILIMIRHENIPYFSMRIWIYVTLIVFLYLAYKYTKVYRVDYPREKINAERKTPTSKEENIYLPNKKRKH